jgi:hypothetical protein
MSLDFAIQAVAACARLAREVQNTERRRLRYVVTREEMREAGVHPPLMERSEESVASIGSGEPGSLRYLAHKLNCRHEHLWQVLIGARKSTSLKERYHALIATGEKPWSGPTKGRKWPVSITFAAAKLDCTAAHLAKVLKGERSSPELKQRYYTLASQLEGGAS